MREHSPRYLAAFDAYVGAAGVALDHTSTSDEEKAAAMPKIKERAHYWARLSEQEVSDE